MKEAKMAVEIAAIIALVLIVACMAGYRRR